ncbi:hypothetical protein LCGC14_1269550 [marine sediment metagenome]|uniref:Uncharacterized protein n=1 Tax=marine sediment metagenome TaxID=412755 RepID=A0A0F9NF89_9ZZZZ
MRYNQITIKERALSHNEISKINFVAKDEKSRIVFVVNLCLAKRYLELSEFNKKKIKAGQEAIVVSFDNIEVLHESSIDSYFVRESSYDPGGSVIHEQICFREDWFWKDYEFLRETFKEEDWHIDVICPEPLNKGRIWLKFYILPQKNNDVVNKFELMDI